nr:hypothetical protein [Tanacetum cinerariifolium]
MAIPVILVSLDLSEDSMGTPAGRVILFGTIHTTIPDTTLSMTSPTTHIDTTPIPIVSPTIPPSPDCTPASPNYLPTSDTKFDSSKDPSSYHIPPLPATLPFLSSTNDSSGSDIPNTPPSPTHGTPFTETTLSTQMSPTTSGALRRRVMVMAIPVILVSLDLSKDSMGTPAGRVILFGTIHTTIPDTTLSMTSPTTHIDTTQIPIVSPTIPPSPDYTPASPDYSPTSDTKFDPSKDPSSYHIPPLPATLPFLSSTDDSSGSDIPNTPPSPTHGTPFIETTLSTQMSPTTSGALRRRVMVLAPR